MTHLKGRTAAFLALGLLAACSQPLDLDLRGDMGGSVDTTDAALNATARRPQPDDRGIISYPNYQVAVARRGDTLADVAARIDLPAAELARYNGVEPGVTLRAGEVIALPARVAEPSPATGAPGTGPIRPASSVDVATLAAGAIDNAAPTPGTQAQAPRTPAARQQTGIEPLRHRVTRGETAFSISRLYNVTPRALAEWNGLDAQFTLREGQFLLIPAPQDRVAAAASPPPAEPDVTQPGSGSPTPVPPSAASPLPAEDTEPAAQPEDETQTAAAPPPTDIGQPAEAASGAAMSAPVSGSIARAFAGERNPGVLYAAAAGAEVRAAASGSVISVSEGSDGTRFVLIRHPDEMLTAYRFVDDVQVSEGDAVSRGQVIAAVDGRDSPALEFRVYRGSTPLDPVDFLR